MLSYIVIASLLEMLVAFVGILFVFAGVEKIKKYIYYFISFSVGTFLGVIFFDLLPEAIELTENEKAPLWVLAGFIAFYLLGRFLFWFHHHEDEHCDHEHTDKKSTATMILTADFVHNFVDGIVIAVAFMADTHLGIVTTVAVLLHEFPQEMSDFFVLIRSGMSKARALFFNFLSSVSTLAGALLGYFALGSAEGMVGPLLGIAAGNFLYIAASDLLPELHRKENTGKKVVQVAILFLGIAIIFAVSNLVGHGH